MSFSDAKAFASSGYPMMPVMYSFRILEEFRARKREEITGCITAKEAAAAGVIAEINTGAVARGLMSELYPSLQFLEYLKAAGVPVCINTDSHKVDTIDFGLDSAKEYAKKAGYDELSYPVEGRIVHIKL